MRGAVWYSDPVGAPVTEVQGNLSNLRSFSHGLHIPDCRATDTESHRNDLEIYVKVSFFP